MIGLRGRKNSGLWGSWKVPPPNCLMLNKKKYSCFCFSNHVLKISGGIEEPGEVRFELAMCLLLGWIIVYFCVWKGIKSAGKVIFSQNDHLMPSLQL